ncbi:MAG TPA: hypothetical protein VLT17_09230 [Gemmatimonadales bacterium]|nr:hypothetical protein [Gemmatimonadales bacterium]
MRFESLLRTLRPLPVAAALWLASPAPVTAQNFSGTFSIEDPAGQRLVLVMSQDGSGRVTGTMRGGATSLTLEGRVSAGVLRGTLSGTQSSGFVEARLQSDTLELTLIDADANHRPDPSKSDKLKLIRVPQPPLTDTTKH